MFNINLVVGPCAVHVDTDERLSLDGVESLLNRATITVLTLMNAHMGAVVKYENLEEDIDDTPIPNNIYKFPNNNTNDEEV